MGVQLDKLEAVHWFSTRFEKAKGRRRVHMHPAQLVLVWKDAKDLPLSIDFRVKDFLGSQLEIEDRECIEGMWKDSFGFDQIVVNMMPGYMRKFFQRQLDPMPALNSQLRVVLSHGWGGIEGKKVVAQIEPRSVGISPAPSTLGPELVPSLGSYAEAARSVAPDIGDDNTEIPASDDEGRTVSEKVSTLSGSLDGMAGEVIRQLQQEMSAQQSMRLTQALEGFETRVGRLEAEHAHTRAQLDLTQQTVSQIKDDGTKTAECVHRLESIIGSTMLEIKETFFIYFD
jgi:hypothetical protein